jgi:hypothetical protein
MIVQMIEGSFAVFLKKVSDKEIDQCKPYDQKSKEHYFGVQYQKYYGHKSANR